ncbi:TetR/AcrR family transcriptional regulator [Frondihabitans sp. 762G35]|uniref:TetR/AcrR family transcriptional regulator n=1 Tax=Frondihabitans sp. 762G35 TaxID=1446794 RepID=UPI000F509ACD|nr:TetR/AcrR family transcriptional regulator [Frondihabitans sp. 762G35]
MTDVAATTDPAPTPPQLAANRDRRLHLADAAIAVLRRRAFHEVDLDVVAHEAGVSGEEIRLLFPTWHDLLVATIDVWNGRRMRPLFPIAQRFGAVAFLRSIVQANIEDPSLMRVLSATVNIAATPGHPMAPYLQDQWHHFHAFVIRQLAVDVTAGREPDTMLPARGAEQLIALYEGLQLQSMVRPTMDLLDAYERGVTRLRDGWSRAYAPAVWDLDVA